MITGSAVLHTALTTVDNNQLVYHGTRADIWSRDVHNAILLVPSK